MALLSESRFSSFVAQDSLELVTVLLLQHPKRWDCRSTSLHSAARVEGERGKEEAGQLSAYFSCPQCCPYRESMTSMCAPTAGESMCHGADAEHSPEGWVGWADLCPKAGFTSTTHQDVL